MFKRRCNLVDHRAVLVRVFSQRCTSFSFFSQRTHWKIKRGSARIPVGEPFFLSCPTNWPTLLRQSAAWPSTREVDLKEVEDAGECGNLKKEREKVSVRDTETDLDSESQSETDGQTETARRSGLREILCSTAACACRDKKSTYQRK